jgi:cytidylate kinase
MDAHLFDDLDLTPEVIERQLDLWSAQRRAAHEENRKPPDAAFRFVTIARDRGSLSDEIAQELSKRMGWHVFDSEIVTYIAKNSHVSENLVRQLDQKSQNLVEAMIERLLRMPEYASFGSDEYIGSLLKTLICLATNGSAILVGRGANFALREDKQGLKVRVTASPEVRVQRLSQRWKVTEEEARRRMQADDEERRKFIRWYYRQDFDDVRFYDIVFNTDRASAERVASSIQAFMSNPKTEPPKTRRQKEGQTG